MNDRSGLNDLLKNEIQIDKVNIFIFKLRKSPRGIQQRKNIQLNAKILMNSRPSFFVCVKREEGWDM